MLREGASQRVTIPEIQSLVVACGCSPVQQARLQDAVRGTAILRSVRQFTDLSLRQDTGVQTPDIVVLAIPTDMARDAVAMARDSRARFPRAALIAYCPGIRDTPASIGALASAGVHQFLFTDINDRGVVLREILASARQQCAADVIMAALRPWVPPPLHPMIEAALSRPTMVRDVRALADALGVHRKTLFNRCTHAAFLSPAELLTWTRIALVAYLLETTGYTIERISIETGYPSPTALRNTVKRHTRLRPMEIRLNGGVHLVIESLRSRLQASSVPPSPGDPTGQMTPLHAL